MEFRYRDGAGRTDEGQDAHQGYDDEHKAAYEELAALVPTLIRILHPLGDGNGRLVEDGALFDGMGIQQRLSRVHGI